VCQVGYLPELYEDARPEKYEILWNTLLKAVVAERFFKEVIHNYVYVEMGTC